MSGPSTYRLFIVIAIVLSTIGCDRVTKTLASSLRGEAPRSFLKDTVRLEYAENRGAFLGLGRGLSEGSRFWLLTIGTGVLLALVALYLATAVLWGRSDFLPWSLLLGGGLSNLIDRVADGGQVVDFLNLGVGRLRTGVFNIADLAITVGALLLLLRYGAASSSSHTPRS
jgi:signal peptidase II